MKWFGGKVELSTRWTNLNSSLEKQVVICLAKACEGQMKISKATSTEAESRYLYSALADFRLDGAREEYAAWLEAQGRKEYARIVRATIQAFQRLDVRPLQKLDCEPNWARMIAVPLLTTFIRAASDRDPIGVRRLRDLVFSRLRPALSLSYAPADSEPKRGASYLWGLPDIPDDETWPKVGEVSDWFRVKSRLPQELHCAFIGQIAFDDMQGTVLGQELPAQGGFAVFAIAEVEQLGIVETLVRPWNNKAALSRHTAPHDLIEDKLGDSTNSPQPAHEIELKEVLSLPDAGDGPFAKEIPGCKYGEEHRELYGKLLDACHASILGFGGYLKGTSGADPSPDIQSLRFAVLRSTPDTGVMHFSVPAADLKNGRLARVQYVWNDWDG
jgi:hypothetical protein